MSSKEKTKSLSRLSQSTVRKGQGPGSLKPRHVQALCHSRQETKSQRGGCDPLGSPQISRKLWSLGQRWKEGIIRAATGLVQIMQGDGGHSLALQALLAQ